MPTCTVPPVPRDEGWRKGSRRDRASPDVVLWKRNVNVGQGWEFTGGVVYLLGVGLKERLRPRSTAGVRLLAGQGCKKEYYLE